MYISPKVNIMEALPWAQCHEFSCEHIYSSKPILILESPVR